MIEVIEYYVIKSITITKLWLICKSIFALEPSRKKWRYVLSGCLIFCSVLIEVVLLQGNTGMIFPLLYMVVLALIFEEKVIKSLKAGMVAFFLRESVDSLLYMIIIHAGRFHMDDILGFEYKLEDIICSLPGLFLWILIANICIKKGYHFNLEGRQYLLMLISVAVSTLQMVVVTYLISGGGYNEVKDVKGMILSLMFISSLCVIYVFLYLTKLLAVDSAQKQTIQAFEKQDEMNRRYYMDLYEKRELERERQHDLKHFLVYLRTRIKDGDYEGAESMLDEMTQSMYSLEMSLVYSQNKIVDAVICGVLGEAINSHQICFSYQGILPQDIHIADMDLCTVLSNALENALEATLQSTQPCKISMHAGCRGNTVIFRIENPVLEETAQIRAGVSKKGDGHGYGIRSMQRIVERYHGELSWEMEAHLCRLSIIFLISSEKSPLH